MKPSQRKISAYLLCFVLTLTSTVPAHLALHLFDDHIAFDNAHIKADIKVIKGYKVPKYLTHTHSDSRLKLDQCDFCFVANAFVGGPLATTVLLAHTNLFKLDIRWIERPLLKLITDADPARAPPFLS